MSDLIRFPSHLSNVVILDCDDVALDWCPGMARFAIDVLVMDVDPSGPHDFNVRSWLGINDRDVMIGILLAFARSEFFACLDPIPGVVEAVVALRASGHEVHFVTSCSSEPLVIRNRERNLESVFGGRNFESVTCVDLGQSKSEILKLHPPSIFIDDRPENILVGASHGHFGMVMTCQTNHLDRDKPNEHGLLWLDGWAEFTPQIPNLPHNLRTLVPTPA